MTEDSTCWKKKKIDRGGGDRGDDGILSYKLPSVDKMLPNKYIYMNLSRELVTYAALTLSRLAIKNKLHS